MQDIISFRALDALKTSSENSNEMARLADIDSKNMVKLTSKSQKDASQLTKITIVTMVYLPASFVAVSTTLDVTHHSASVRNIWTAIFEHGLPPRRFCKASSHTKICFGNVDFRSFDIRLICTYICGLVVLGSPKCLGSISPAKSAQAEARGRKSVEEVRKMC